MTKTISFQVKKGEEMVVEEERTFPTATTTTSVMRRMKMTKACTNMDDSSEESLDVENEMMDPHDLHSLLSSSPTSVYSTIVAAAAAAAAAVPPQPAKHPTPKPKQQQPEEATACHTAWSQHPMPASQKSLRTRNPIRAIVDPIIANIQSGQERADGKIPISLALGDPTAAGNHLPPCPVAIRAVTEALQSGHTASYANALGSLPARQAIAGFHSSSHHDDGSSCTNAVSLEADHVVIANGCSGALELALTALLDSDSIVLVPEPGFPLYQVIAESHGATVLKYRLLEHEEWHVDLNHVHEILRLQQHQQSTTKSTTTSIHGGAEDHQPRRQVRAMIINNPSNPTGAVYSLQHLTEIVKFCQVHRLPIVADEVYGDLVFSANGSGDGGGPAASFVPMATVAAQLGRTVPVITASGIGKQFLLPGWRVGWLCFHDNIYGSLREVEAGAKRLAQVILGASHLAQSVVPALLSPSSPEVQLWKSELRQTLERQAQCLCRQLSITPCLQLVMQPQGAMYAMIRIRIDRFNETVQNDVDFAKLLLQEENVIVLPGICFGMPNAFRVVFCAPIPVLQEAADRIQQFCLRHSKTDTNHTNIDVQ